MHGSRQGSVPCKASSFRRTEHGRVRLLQGEAAQPKVLGPLGGTGACVACVRGCKEIRLRGWGWLA